MDKTQRITIAGAGLAGALLATRLAQHGIEVTLLEKRVDLRRHDLPAGRSINLALAARGIQALELANVMHHIEPLCIPMPGRMLHAPDGGMQFQPYSGNPGEVNYSVSRSELNRVLLDAAEATGRVGIRFGQAVEQYDPASGRLFVHDTVDDRRYELDAVPLIAADGAGSVIRHALAASGTTNEEFPLSHGYKELTIPPGADNTWQITREALHIWPRGGFMLIALPNLDGSFTATLFLAHEGDNSFATLHSTDDVMTFFRREFSDAVPLIPSLADDFFANPTGHMGTVRCSPWHHAGNALLLGDAAHAIVPFHGQGMNAAFEDVSVLDTVLAEHGCDWPAVFATFSTRRKTDTDAVADMALENYIEMRDTVRDPAFQLQKTLGWELEKRYPRLFIPRYSMVMFHPEIPYAQAMRRGRIQQVILEELTANAKRLEDVDLAQAEMLIKERL